MPKEYCSSPIFINRKRFNGDTINIWHCVGLLNNNNNNHTYEMMAWALGGLIIVNPLKLLSF